MFDPSTITFNSRLLLVARFDGAEYYGNVPWSIRINPLRYSLTLWPGTLQHRTSNKNGRLYLKMANAIYALRRG